MTTPWGFADYDAHEALHFLHDEASGLRATLDGPRSGERWEVVERTNATLEQVLDVFQDPRYRGRIVLTRDPDAPPGSPTVLELRVNGVFDMDTLETDVVLRHRTGEALAAALPVLAADVRAGDTRAPALLAR